MNKRAVTRKLESFNNKCLRRILGITKAQQCTGRITSAEVRRRFGVEEMLEDVVAAKRLRWAGHVARMEDCRLPKRLMFGWLHQKRPAHGGEQLVSGTMRHRTGINGGYQVYKEDLTTCTEERQEKMNSCDPLMASC